MTPGIQFQNDFKNSLSPLLSCVRLNDSRKALKHEKNPGDFIVFNAQTLNFIELKTILGKSISIGESNDYKIKLPQLRLVCEEALKPNCEGWYIINFREYSETYRILARSIKGTLVDQLKKKAITIELCKEFGFVVPEKDGVYDLRFLNPVIDSLEW